MKRITPFLWFSKDAEKAARFYTSIFKNSKLVSSGPMSSRFRIEGLEFIAFNGGPGHAFTPAVSMFVSCRTQREVDFYWKRLVAGGKAGRCGWLTDKFGLSWQVVPEVLGDLIGDPDPAKSGRALKAMLAMRKLDIGKLRRAHAGRRR